MQFDPIDGIMTQTHRDRVRAFGRSWSRLQLAQLPNKYAISGANGYTGRRNLHYETAV
jgi:hypothetical protein